MKQLIYSAFLGILLLSINACKKETETVRFDVDANYFPDDSGSFVIYKVDSIIYNDFFWDVNAGVGTTGYQRNSSYFVKEVIDEQFIDNLGRKARKIKRFISSDTILNPFTTEETNVWYMVKNDRNVEKIEDNIRYVKLTFPSVVNNSWKGNKYFLNEIPFSPLKNVFPKFDWNYTITEKDKRYSYAGKNFDSTLTVLQIADSSVVYKLYSEEKFARKVGLVYKELWRLDAQPIRGQVRPFLLTQLNGFIVKQYVLSYGKQ